MRPTKSEITRVIAELQQAWKGAPTADSQKSNLGDLLEKIEKYFPPFDSLLTQLAFGDVTGEDAVVFVRNTL